MTESSISSPVNWGELRGCPRYLWVAMAMRGTGARGHPVSRERTFLCRMMACACGFGTMVSTLGPVLRRGARGPSLDSNFIQWLHLARRPEERGGCLTFFSGLETLLSLSPSHQTLPQGPCLYDARRPRKKHNLHQKDRGVDCPTHWISASVPEERQTHTQNHACIK